MVAIARRIGSALTQTRRGAVRLPPQQALPRLHRRHRGTTSARRSPDPIRALALRARTHLDGYALRHRQVDSPRSPGSSSSCSATCLAGSSARCRSIPAASATAPDSSHGAPPKAYPLSGCLSRTCVTPHSGETNGDSPVLADLGVEEELRRNRAFARRSLGLGLHELPHIAPNSCNVPDGHADGCAIKNSAPSPIRESSRDTSRSSTTPVVSSSSPGRSIRLALLSRMRCRMPSSESRSCRGTS